MIDKYTVLPLTPCVCGLVANEYCASCEARQEQRDSDWKRIEPLVGALEKIRNESLMRLRGLSNPVDRLPWEKVKALANEALALLGTRP